MAGMELMFDQGFRLDGRKPNEVRRINCRLGIFGQADGSAYIEQGNTKILAAVYGPHETPEIVLFHIPVMDKLNKYLTIALLQGSLPLKAHQIRGSKAKTLHDRVLLNCQYSMATFSTGERKRRPRGDRKSLEIGLKLRQTFESALLPKQYPRSQIDIFFEVLQSDGGNYSTCVNVGTLALIDAGIPLKDFVCSCSSGLFKETPIVDINYMEETLGTPSLTLAIVPKTEEIVLIETNGRLHIDLQSNLIDNAMKGCKDIYAILEEAVKQHVSKLNFKMNKE